MDPILFVSPEGLRRLDLGDDLRVGIGSEPASRSDVEMLLNAVAASLVAPLVSHSEITERRLSAS